MRVFIHTYILLKIAGANQSTAFKRGPLPSASHGLSICAPLVSSDIMPASPPIGDERWPNWRTLTSLEQTFAHANVPEQPLVITALFGFSSRLPDDFVPKVFAPRFAAHPRFRSTLSFSRGTGRTSFAALAPDAPPVPPGVVFTEAAADSSATPTERAERFHARVDDIASLPIPSDGPLWRIHFFPGFVIDEPGLCEGGTVLVRIHHVCGDGVGLVNYCFETVADTVEGKEVLKFPAGRRKGDVGGEHAAPSMMGRAREVLGDAAKVFLGVAIPDSKSVFSEGALGMRKFLHFVPPSRLKLEDLKASAKLQGGTVTGILLAALSGMCREYMLATEAPAPAFPPARFHAVLTVNNHGGGGREVSMSNELLLLPVPLHVGDEERSERLRLALADIKSLKEGRQPFFASVALKMLSVIPAALRVPLWRYFTRRASLVVTSLAGPNEKCSIGGCTIDSIAVGAPADGHCGAVATIFSYAGRCSLVFGGDKKRVTRPSELESRFFTEFEEMRLSPLT